MAKVLPFDSATIGGTSLTTANVVNGSGSLTFTGTDITVTTADGKIHQFRQSKMINGSLEAYGDQSAVQTPVGLSEAHTVGGVSITGIATATYNRSSETTRIEVRGDPAS